TCSVLRLNRRLTGGTILRAASWRCDHSRKRTARQRSTLQEDPMRPSYPPATIVLVHGLWMSGFELNVLKHRLEAEANCCALAFSYPSLTGTMSDHARSLIEFARSQPTSQLHFIGHSLGGLVILRALELTNDLAPGRAVLLGTPLQGSQAARGVA